jgi:alpha-galactosidase
VHLVERLPEGAGAGASVVGGGELLRPGEVRLAPGEEYATPETLFVWSASGLDGVSARVHTALRARPHHPRGPRPLVLNIWEAVYFQHDLDTLKHLADVAASIGVERYVVDDGWFGSRRDDSSGLGDWYVSEDVWPQGLAPLFDHVHSLGMQVGLWFEPEMVNPDSRVVRDHPDWVLTPSAPLWRRQQVLDVAHPGAHAYLLERLDSLVSEHGIDYLKWDHNRDLHVAEHAAPDGRLVPGVHTQTLALYRLLDELRSRHPGLEIESCASGGARVDLGILEHTDRVWTSDCNDALERQAIQRWTGLLLPPELMGAHIGPPESHTTGRVLSLPFRAITALFGHAGLEWDITTCSPAELEVLRRWTALYRSQRDLLHGGRVVRADLADPGAYLHGVVAPDASRALFAYVRLTTSPDAVPGRVRFPGLDRTRSYTVRVRSDLEPDLDGASGSGRSSSPPWCEEPVRLPGAVLADVGLPMPLLDPASALLMEITA